MATQLQWLMDRAEITDLLARLGSWLDEQRFDEAGDIFTEDAEIETPGGKAQGLDKLIAQARRNHEDYSGTQHVFSNVLIQPDGDQATLGADQIGTFTKDTAVTRQVGARYRFEAVRTPQGWRFSRMWVVLAWDRDLAQQAV